MKTLVLFFFFFISILCFGQEKCQAYGNGSDEELSREILSLSISPLAVIDVYNGSSYKAGISIQPFRPLRFTADFGSYFLRLGKNSLWFNVKGYNFRASAGINLGYLSPFSVGLEYQYKKEAFNYNDSLPNEPGFTAKVNKFVHVFNAYLSYKVELTSRIYLELRGNLGLRYRNIHNTHSAELTNSVYWWDSMNTGRLTNKQSFMPNLNFAVRLNYILYSM